MSYTNKALYHGLNLQAAISNEDLIAIEKSYGSVSYFIDRERVVYGDAAMEDLFEALTPEMIAAIETAEEIMSSIDSPVFNLSSH